jgi:tetratricopeptide (TPR) repeat protein
MGQTNEDHLSSAEFHSLFDRIADDAGARGPQELEAHLAECAQCRAERQLYGEADALMCEAAYPAAASQCPPEYIWQQVSAGRLTPAEETDALEHAITCASCAAALSASIRFQGSASREQLIASIPVRPIRRLYVWAGAIAASLLIAFGLRTLSRPGLSDVLHRTESLLARAYTESRPLEFRLPDNGYTPVERTNAQEISPSLRKALPSISESLAAHKDNPELMRLHAEAELLQPQASVAAPVATLEKLRRQNPSDKRNWLPLAAGYFRRAEAQPESAALDYTKALELVDSIAEQSPHDMPALFNSALIRMRLHDRAGAIEAWEKYLKEDSDSGYAEEARRNLAELNAASH